MEDDSKYKGLEFHIWFLEVFIWQQIGVCMYLVPPANYVVDGLPEEQRRVETPHKADTP